MNPYSQLADDHFVNMTLSTQMDLPNAREPVLHYFEQIQKKYPRMGNFYLREPSTYVLEEDKDRGDYRWCTIEPRRISSGQVNPESVEHAIDQHMYVLDQAPYALSVSSLDCEALDFMLGFDFNYRGNHNQLLSEALGVTPALDRLSTIPGATIVNHEPNITFALDEDCRLQCRVSVEARTTEYQLRSGEFQEDPLSVYITTRYYGSLAPGEQYTQMLERLWTISRDIVDNYAAESILQPLARTIALG